MTITSKGAQGAVNWSTGAVWIGDSAPATGDTVVIADGDFIALDANISMAQISSAGNTGYLTCGADRTITLTGAGITYGGTLTAGFLRLTAGALTIVGSGAATGTVVSTAAGTTLIVSGTATYSITPVAGQNALTSSSSGIALSDGSASPANASSIAGPIVCSGSGYGIRKMSSSTIAITGAVSLSGSGGGYAVRCDGGTINFSGGIVDAIGAIGGTGVLITGGTLNWTGVQTIANGADAQMLIGGGTVNLGVSSATPGTTDLVINNNGGRLVIRKYSGTMNTTYCTINNTVAAAQTCILGQTVTVTGPTIPAAGDVRNGTANGYSGAPATGTCYVPAAADVQSGVAVDATTGTFTAPAVGDVQDGVTYGGGGTEYEGTFVVPDAADVWYGTGGYGAGGTEFTPAMRASHITVTGGAAATLTAPDILTGIVVDDITGSAVGATLTAEDVWTYAGTRSLTTAPPTAAQIKTAMEASDSLLGKMAPLIIGTVTNAGTTEETFAYGGVTVVVTVDDDGNRSEVVFS